MSARTSLVTYFKPAQEEMTLLSLLYNKKISLINWKWIFKIFAGKKSYNSAFLSKAKYVCEKCWNWDFIWDKMENHIPHSNLIFPLFSSHTAIHLGLGFKRKLYLEILILKLLKWIEFNNRNFLLNQTITAQMNGSRIQHNGNVSFQVKLQCEPCLHNLLCDPG